MKPSSYWGPAAGKSGLGPVVLAMKLGRAVAALDVLAPVGGAVGAAGAIDPHAANNGRAAPTPAVTKSSRRLSVMRSSPSGIAGCLPLPSEPIVRRNILRRAAAPIPG